MGCSCDFYRPRSRHLPLSTAVLCQDVLLLYFTWIKKRPQRPVVSHFYFCSAAIAIFNTILQCHHNTLCLCVCIQSSVSVQWNKVLCISWITVRDGFEACKSPPARCLWPLVLHDMRKMCNMSLTERWIPNKEIQWVWLTFSCCIGATVCDIWSQDASAQPFLLVILG